MSAKTEIAIRAATAADDRLIARHFFQMWRDNDVPEAKIAPDWEARVLAFFADARARLGYAGFVAEADGAVVGSAGGQIFAGLYPDVLMPEHRRYGYIWGVYVEPGWRCRGVARQLTERVIAHLRGLGCTRAILHSSPHGRTVYDRLGFAPTNELALDLR